MSSALYNFDYQFSEKGEKSSQKNDSAKCLF